MANGDVKWFAAFDKAAKDLAAFDFVSDTLKLGLVTNAVVPAVGTLDPRWGSGGGTNFSTSQVGTGTGYSGPITLAGVTYTRTAGVVTLDANDVSVPLDASGFTDAYYGIIYDDTVAGKYAIGYVDLGGPRSITSAPLNINWSSLGVLSATAS